MGHGASSHWAWGMGHGAWGMGHGAWGIIALGIGHHRIGHHRIGLIINFSPKP
jgi:hypothetical protein